MDLFVLIVVSNEIQTWMILSLVWFSTPLSLMIINDIIKFFCLRDKENQLKLKPFEPEFQFEQLHL